MKQKAAERTLRGLFVHTTVGWLLLLERDGIG